MLNVYPEDQIRNKTQNWKIFYHSLVSLLSLITLSNYKIFRCFVLFLISKHTFYKTCTLTGFLHGASQTWNKSLLDSTWWYYCITVSVQKLDEEMKTASSKLYWKGMLRRAWDRALLNASGLHKASPVVCKWMVLKNSGQKNPFCLSFSLRDISSLMCWPRLYLGCGSCHPRVLH